MFFILAQAGCTTEIRYLPAQNDDTPADESQNQGDRDPQGSENDSDEGNETGSSSTSALGLTEDEWSIIYTGYGSIEFTERGIIIAPTPAYQNDVTHAPLLLAKATERCPLKDLTLTIKANTEEQLRQNDPPKTWEVFWLFINFIEDDGVNDEMANYFILKTNGIELGRTLPEGPQEYLYTASEPRIEIGKTHTYHLEKRGGHLTVSVDGVEVINYTSGSGPDFIYDHAGSIGIYSEDARVAIESIELTPHGDYDPSCY